MTRQAWVNGVYVAADEAKISPFDRGFLFADGVYEVTAVYDGRLIDMERHLDRLERSLRELKFGTMPDRRELEDAHRASAGSVALRPQLEVGDDILDPVQHLAPFRHWFHIHRADALPG